MYKMMGAFLTEINKIIEKTGTTPNRPHSGQGDVFIGHRDHDVVFCYKGEFFFVLPERYQLYKEVVGELGPDFKKMLFKEEFECTLTTTKILHPSNNKQTLREITSSRDETPMIFSKRGPDGLIYYDKAYIQEKYAGWFGELTDYYGGMTELWTDGKGAFILKRVNGDLLAVALEVRIR